MTSRWSMFRRVSYGVFRWLPPGLRRRIVRTLTPNYTVGAVLLVRDHDGALLLLRQPRSTGWSLPGGLVERGEAPAEAAARELAEETGLVIDSAELVPASPNARISARAQQVDMVFTATIDDAAPALTLDPVEVREAGWYPADALPPLTEPTARLVGAYGIGPYGAPDYTTNDTAALPEQPTGDTP
jgi:ADP-ribose pyrophosphatase YjhB (NUDIX family)